MFKDRIARDLTWLTAVKVGVILVIYWALFAPLNGRPVDTAAHLLGPITTQRGQ